MNQIVLEHPVSLLLALLVPLFFVLQKKGILKIPSLELTMSDWNGTSFIWKSAGSRVCAFLVTFFAVCAFLLTVIALSEPSIVSKEKIFLSRGTDILFVLDISPSMAARDIARDGGGMNSRFDAAKEIILSLSQKASGQMGIVSFASESVLSVPVTSDMDFFSNRLNEIKVGALGDGSGIGTGLALAVYHLASDVSSDETNSGGAAAKNQIPKKCAVLLTDGENNAGSIHPLTAARLAREHDITFYVAGLGTKGRVPLEYVDPHTGSAYSGFLDSRFDEAALKNLASEGGGLFFPVTTLNELAASLETVSAREQTTQVLAYKNNVTYFYRTFVFAAIMCAIFVWIIKKIVLKESL